MYPRVAVSGSPRERGRQYGEATADRIRRSLDAYRGVFAHFAGWSWEQVRTQAARFVAPIASHGSKYLEEMRGIGEGADVDLLDIVALNVRTEIMFAASPTPPAECSSFAALPRRTVDGALLVGQNWDWLVHSSETVVVLEAEQDDGPAFVSVVEAGLLAKCGMNAAGLAIATNALVAGADVGRPGVPYHVLLRSLLDCPSPADALAMLQRADRSSSGNFLVAHQCGLAVDVEAVAGHASDVFVLHPVKGLLLHTNHFLSPRFRGRDVSLELMPDSSLRLRRLRELLGDAGRPLDVALIESALADHEGHPSGVCCHIDRGLPPQERSVTAASVVMDVAARELWLASGNPCEAVFERLDYSTLLDRPTAVAPLQAV